MYVRHLDSTCTLNAKEIETLDSPALDRMHRFIRLWKALTGDAQSGWTISSLDRVIASPVLGAMKLNTDCVSTVTAVARAAKLLSSQITTTLEDVIDLFAMLRILPPSDALTQFGTTYTSLFLNATAHGPVDPLFELRTIGLNDSTTPPAAPPKLSDSVDYIARCLGIGSSDATNIIQSIATQPANSILTIANLSKVYAVVSLSRRLGLSVSDYFLFTQLSSLTPLQDLGHLESFTEVVAKLQAQNLSAPNIQFITQPPTTPPSSADITTTQIIEILINLQGQYFTIQGANQSPYDATLTATENETAALSLISQIQGVSQTDLSLFRQMLDSGLNASDGEALINNKLASIGTVACATIATAQSQFAASPGDTSLQNMLVQVVADTLSAYFAQLQRETALEGVLSDAFNFDTDVTAALLQGVPSLQSLLDEKLAAGTITDTNFPQQFQAILLIFRLSFLLPNFGLSTTNLSWLLQNAGSLGWATLSSLPTLSTRPPISWDSWLALIDYIAVVNAAEFPDVQNSADKNSPFTLNGFLSLVLATEPQGPDPTPLVPYFCSLTANDPTIISALVTSFGYKNPSFKRADTLRKLDSAANIIRKLNMPPANAIFLAEAQTPSLDDTAAARNALKLRYLVNSDWLDVLKTIQDPLRLQKRDALIDYLLAYNKPNLTSATDLSEILLIDVEMSTETLTSRIIQAHQSVQQFAQRLLMGLEPTPLVDDPTWSHWAEMSQYRLWEANKKVFLYPETWIEPELRDNKSELYVQLEEELKKQPITTTTSELAVAGYLSGLDSIAELEVMSCFYDVPSSTLHVFARTKGGNPRVYYHRTLVLEAVWSPWEKLDGVEITGNHLLSFLRSNRLTVMWPVFTYEQNPNQVNQPPPYPDPNNLTNSDGSQKSADPIEQRLKVQLAVSEQNPDTGKWSARVVGEDGVYWPQNNSYSPATDFSDSLEDSIGLFYWDFGGNLGQAIMVCENVSTQVGRIAVNVFGAFNMTGCKGYPVPFSSTKRELAYYFYTLPAFRNTDYVTERFVKSQDLATNSPSDLAIMTVLSGSEYDILLGKEYGQFVVTYPTQPTIIDRAFVAWEMYALGLSASGSKTTEMMVSEGYRRLIVPQGIFLPYFVSDSSTREYVITPGYESSNTDDTNFRTASATLNFFNRVVVLVLKYIDVYFNKINKNITELRKLVNEDDEYKTLKKELLSVYVDATNIRGPKLRQLKVDMASFYHPLVCFLRSQLYSSGLPGLLARTTQLQVTNFDFNTVYQPTAIVRQPYPREELDFSLSGPYAGYNWELFFHLPFQIASSLSDDQQFDKAQDWYHYIFNPEGADLEDPDTGPDRATAPQKKYWQTQPFFRTQVKDYISERIDSILGAVAADPNGFSLANDLKTQVRLWRTNPYSPHVIARTRPVAYQMCIFMKYVQNLLGWGDNLFAQLTRETITQASTLYMVADKLLGSKPQTVQPAVPVPVRTYNELGSSIDILGNALLGIENLIPDLGSLPHGGKELPQPPAPPLTSLYFGIPPNDNMLQLWDLVADRLYKIRHSQDINGNFIQLALTSPPIDPGALIKALASGASLSDIIGGLNAPLPHYRFGYVLERAQALVQHVVELGQQLLAVLEKRDAEGLARLRAQSELTVLASVRGVKLAAIAQNALAIKALQAGKAVAQERQAYYAGLLTVPINPEEQLSLSKNADAIVVDGVMALGHVAAAEANLVPSFSVGVEGFGGSPSATVSFGGSNVAGSISSLMAAAASARSILATEAGLYSTKASYTRRTAEWQFQMALAQGDMAHIDAEIAAANGTGATLQAELVAHDTTATESASAAAYLKNKFTNTELYDWAVRRVSGVYYQAFQLAFSMAKKAERCMAFELGDFSASSAFIQYGYWDNLRSGLLAGGDLQLALDRLGTAYIDRHMRELELTKSISLAQLDPTALLNLRTAGTCMFSLPETLFDLDFPGHYFRRTKNIALSIPCVVGPYTSVSATLRLLSSRYRAATANATASGYPEAAGGNDPRFIYNVVPPPTMAATSSAVNDAGVFELRSDDPRYLPFEHAGVLGTYSLSLSPTQQFPYAAVADAILTISYTARDGGSALQGAAKTAPTAGVAAIGLRTAFPVEWNALKAGRAVEPILAGAAQLPYWATAQGRGVDVGVTVWCAVPASGQDLDGVVLVVAGQALALTKDSDGVFWKATLPAKAVVFGKSVSVAWKVADDRAKVDEIICVVDFGVKSS
ncbi:uncharacterized protein K444DRAFT_622549 [Hyaloscypha bicolor E]|uniref:Toxin subunit n=1 Tax=Hyaloscypha bicolor E TaxID=1095630 RepID=A0A2J6SGN9_9HELO|nr:uncharacterized protein K444DRAFT_622549 [Hyaloscypha bicolor E]PMD49942.1 hypothetical protein K444DRAFT_622549 [Hyaloscypha bicolor E]